MQLQLRQELTAVSEEKRRIETVAVRTMCDLEQKLKSAEDRIQTLEMEKMEFMESTHNLLEGWHVIHRY